MVDQLFPQDIASATPASGDIILIADISDSNNPKDCTLAELPISTATQTALNAKQDTLTGLTASVTELNYTDGVTSAIQTQLDGKASSLGADDNYVTDAEKIVIGNTSGTNTGDQTNISGNAATVTTNANLTGHITSTGNAAILGSFTFAQLNTAVSDADVARTDAANTFTGVQTTTQVISINNAITASGNSATIPITHKLHTVTNNSAATLTITLTTSGATDGQIHIVRILDFSAVPQTLVFVNTENSDVSVPTTSNGSTTLPRTGAFMFNSSTSKWRCLANV